MPQELRSILFSEDEARLAVTRLMMTRARVLPAGQVRTLAIRLVDGAVHAGVRMSSEPDVEYALGPHELMTAVLMHCRASRIPLHTRSQKRLGIFDGCLSLIMALNPRRIDPWVVGDRVFHALSDPLLPAPHAG